MRFKRCCLTRSTLSGYVKEVDKAPLRWLRITSLQPIILDCLASGWCNEALQHAARWLIRGLEGNLRHSPRYACDECLTAADPQSGLRREFTRHQLRRSGNSSFPGRNCNAATEQWHDRDRLVKKVARACWDERKPITVGVEPIVERKLRVGSMGQAFHERRDIGR